MNQYIAYHVMFDVFGCKTAQIEDFENMMQLLKEIAKLLNANIVDTAHYKFKPQGLSIALIISESHITLHTWPEKGYIGIDVFTCTENYNILDVEELIMETVEHSSIKKECIFRGIEY